MNILKTLITVVITAVVTSMVKDKTLTKDSVVGAYTKLKGAATDVLDAKVIK